MKGIVRYGLGAGELEYREVPMPKVGPGDVLMQVKAAGLCGSDIHTYDGRVGGIIPQIIGHEFAGVVAEVGERVTAWKAGDRVVSDNTAYLCGKCHGCMTGNIMECAHRYGLGYGIDGGFAEYVLIPEVVLNVFPNCLTAIPDNMTFDEAAIMDPASNGYHTVVQQGALMPGESMGVVGVGPLGLGAIASARAMGAVDVFAIVRKTTSKLHRDLALKMGATRILESETDDIEAISKAATDGEGLALIVETAGANALFPVLTASLRYGGRMVYVGYDWNVLNSTLNRVIVKSLQLIGHTGYTPIAWHNVMRMISAGIIDIKQMITHTLPLSEFEEGVRLMKAREAVKVIFHP